MESNKLTPNISVKSVSESVLFYRETLGFNLEMSVLDGTTRIENEILEKEVKTPWVKSCYLLYNRNSKKQDLTPCFIFRCA